MILLVLFSAIQALESTSYDRLIVRPSKFGYDEFSKGCDVVFTDPRSPWLVGVENYTTVTVVTSV